MGFGDIFKSKKQSKNSAPSLDTPPPPPSDMANNNSSLNDINDTSLPSPTDMGDEMNDIPSMNIDNNDNQGEMMPPPPMSDEMAAPPKMQSSSDTSMDLPELPDFDFSSPGPLNDVSSTKTNDENDNPFGSMTQKEHDDDSPSIYEPPKLEMPDDDEDIKIPEATIKTSTIKPVVAQDKTNKKLEKTAVPIAKSVFLSIDQYREIINNIEYIQGDIMECETYHEQIEKHLKEGMEESYKCIHSDFTQMQRKLAQIEKVLFER